MRPGPRRPEPMKPGTLALFVVVGIVALLGGCWFAAGPIGPAVSLIDRFDAAEKRSTEPVAEAFAVRDVTLAGETRRAIFAHASSRLTFPDVTLPGEAWLHVAIGIEEAAWTAAASDGVVFRVGVSDGRDYEELLARHLDPASQPGDRRWLPLVIDLTRYGGERVDLIFNTNASPPGADNREFDLAVWGTPEIHTRR